MQLTDFVNTLGADLKKRYSEKVHKLTLHGNFSCPNRDGTLGKGGCTFCNVAAFADENQAGLSIKNQLSLRAQEVAHKANKYLAYFQAYTSTYAEIAQLASLYKQATENINIVGICVGTRPDCVSDEVLNLLSSYLLRGYEVWLELGLQSANDKTLKCINRGHGFADYQSVCIKARARGIKVCTHLILGLPRETQLDYRQTLNRVIETGVDGLKLHPLHIVRGATMEKSWRAGRLSTLSLDEYSQVAVDLIRHTPREIVFHRISATAKLEELLSPLWCEKRWPVQNRIAKLMQQQGGQGTGL
ncbi:TIGR01212 family radical SAM protein [Psychromonas antarctica]|jgi:radical SAM protein (TIGR01212 family)|uniref:TIGR01212 family radical SAM protein n=1 Tax=Psychromonas antarctica TaxID=67573 RepID=UPI001EE84DD6|nr:TIGR01212 family radical SAM protein [Psychromonas antarctica]MCG6202560.1 TIGR01212 family radical SAM protein [Psychromonas antarctica]